MDNEHPTVPVRLWDIRETDPATMAQALNEAQQAIIELQNLVKTLRDDIKAMDDDQEKGDKNG